MNVKPQSPFEASRLRGYSRHAMDLLSATLRSNNPSEIKKIMKEVAEYLKQSSK